MKVLSLFDGISCGMAALERAGIPVERYVAYEVEPSAIKISQKNYPQIEHCGDVTTADFTQYEGFDLLIGGSPCQSLSIVQSKTRQHLDGKSKLFFEFVRAKEEMRPKYFLFENVASMNDESKQAISECLGCEPIFIDSGDFSAQERPRYYWTNIPNVVAPEDRHISFQDYKETNPLVCAKYKLKKTPSRLKMWNNGGGRNSVLTGCANVTFADKIYCITAKQDRCPNSGLIECEDFCRFLTRAELEQAQTIPVGYTDMLSYSQMQDVVGNAWTVDVIAHILSFYTKASDKTK